MTLKEIRNQFMSKGYNRSLIDKTDDLINIDKDGLSKASRRFIDFWSHRLTIPHEKPRCYDIEPQGYVNPDRQDNRNKSSWDKANNIKRIQKAIVDNVIDMAGIKDKDKDKDKWYQAAKDKKIAKLAKLNKVPKAKRVKVSGMTPQEFKDHRNRLAKQRYDPAKQKDKTLKDREWANAYYHNNKDKIKARRLERESGREDEVRIKNNEIASKYYHNNKDKILAQYQAKRDAKKNKMISGEDNA